MNYQYYPIVCNSRDTIKTMTKITGLKIDCVATLIGGSEQNHELLIIHIWEKIVVNYSADSYRAILSH